MEYDSAHDISGVSFSFRALSQSLKFSPPFQPSAGLLHFPIIVKTLLA